MDLPPPYEEVVAHVPNDASSRLQLEIAALERAKKAAVENEDFGRAKELKEEIDALTKNSTQLVELEARKKKAVDEENYALAQQIKKEIDALKSGRVVESRSNCHNLGQGCGYLLHIKIPQAVQTAVRPTPVIVLDRSLSMKGSCRWAITVAVPTALSGLGYSEMDRCILLTFDSVVERVQVKGQDPMLHQLWTIDVSARGKTTMMAQVFEQLQKVIQPSRAYNVFVISDGFVHDIANVRPAVRDISQQGLTNGSRVSFALFRFFNGSPPDTSALAATASIGNDGTSPCLDCIPPMEWLCPNGHATSFRKLQCDSCSAFLAVKNPGKDGVEPLRQFCLTAQEAFTLSLQPHIHVRPFGSQSTLSRVPFSVPSAFQELGIDLPCGQEVLLALREPISGVLVGESKMEVSTLNTLPSEQILTDFCMRALVQLRLWAVGGVRKRHSTEAIEWFRQLARLRANVGNAQSNNVKARAWGLRRRLEDSESPLGRICALGEAETFVARMNSKQQGDFLRGTSVVRSELVLTRRAFGSDIFFHDAARAAIAAMPSADDEPQGAPEAKDQYASYYGGGTASDSLTAAGILSCATEDLLASDILEVVGGVGCSFSGEISAEKADALWAWDVRAVDASSFLSEADVWAARAAGEPLRLAGQLISGVVPLAMCNSSAYATYYKLLSPLALLHVGAQLHGSPAKQPWGWEPSNPPYVLEEALATREAAVLRCLLSTCVGISKVPSQAEATLCLALVAQLRERSALMHADHLQAVQLAWLRDKPIPCTALLAFAITSWSSVSDKNRLDPRWARRLYSIEVSEAASQAGLVSTSPNPRQLGARDEAIVRLLAVDPEKQRVAISEDQIQDAVKRRLEGIGAYIKVDVNAEVAAPALLQERLSRLLPLPHTVFGLSRLLAARGSGTDANVARDHLMQAPSPAAETIWFGTHEQTSDLFPVYVAAAVLATGERRPPETIESATDLPKLLTQLLETSLRNDHTYRIGVAVAQQLQAKREALERTLERKHNDHVSIDLAHLEAIAATIKQNQVTADNPRPHISFAFCGDCDSGKSTIIGRLLMELGMLSLRELTKLHKEASQLGKTSFVFAFAMDRLRIERERGLSVILKKNWIPTSRYIATLLDTPGHRDFVKNTLRGIAQADVGVIVVPADSRFESTVTKGNAQLGEREGAVRVHAQMLSTFGVKQLIILVNKMDAPAANFSEARFRFIVGEVRDCLRATGWKNVQSFPIIPIAGFYGENLIYHSSKMPWWRGHDVPLANGSSIVTVMDALNEYAVAPVRELNKPLRIPLSNVFRIKGIGDVFTGRIEQGVLRAGANVNIIGCPLPLSSRAMTIETHHCTLTEAGAGRIIGINCNNIPRANMPKIGDVLVLQDEPQLAIVRRFTAEVLTQHHGHLAVGYTPLCAVRTARHSVSIEQINWKKTPAGETIQKPPFLTRGDVAEVVFIAKGPLVLDTFSNCEGLGRVIFLDSKESVMIGKVTQVTAR